MQPRTSPPRRADPALAGELIGAAITVDAAPGVRGLPWSGTIVDETLGTFHIRRTGHPRARVLAKRGLEGSVLLGGRELPLSGDLLRVRPEDRTKRLGLRGPRSKP
ncbi:MAG TPA: ribonuclease P protein subunit [Thermoplasmata archaeon]|nr:ribonuclease P protein subunit [Thermoplasmata archaeon]